MTVRYPGCGWLKISCDGVAGNTKIVAVDDDGHETQLAVEAVAFELYADERKNPPWLRLTPCIGRDLLEISTSGLDLRPGESCFAALRRRIDLSPPAADAS